MYYILELFCALLDNEWMKMNLRKQVIKMANLRFTKYEEEENCYKPALSPAVKLGGKKAQ